MSEFNFNISKTWNDNNRSIYVYPNADVAIPELDNSSLNIENYYDNLCDSYANSAISNGTLIENLTVDNPIRIVVSKSSNIYNNGASINSSYIYHNTNSNKLSIIINEGTLNIYNIYTPNTFSSVPSLITKNIRLSDNEFLNGNWVVYNSDKSKIYPRYINKNNGFKNNFSSVIIGGKFNYSLLGNNFTQALGITNYLSSDIQNIYLELNNNSNNTNTILGDQNPVISYRDNNRDDPDLSSYIYVNNHGSGVSSYYYGGNILLEIPIPYYIYETSYSYKAPSISKISNNTYRIKIEGPETDFLEKNKLNRILMYSIDGGNYQKVEIPIGNYSSYYPESYYDITISDNNYGNHTISAYIDGFERQAGTDDPYILCYAYNSSSELGSLIDIRKEVFTYKKSLTTTYRFVNNPPAPTGLTATISSERPDLFTISWNSVTNVSGYTVTTIEGELSKIYDNGNSTSYNFIASTPGYAEIKISSYYKIDSSLFTSDSPSVITVTSTKLPTSFNAALENKTANSGTLSWRSQYADTAYTKYKVIMNDLEEPVYYGDNTYFFQENLPQGLITYKITQVCTTNSKFNSNIYEYKVSTNKEEKPYNIKFTRDGVNYGTVTWSASKIYNDDITSFNIYLDGELYGNTKNKNYTLSNITQGDHYVELEQVYEQDNSFNSDKSSQIPFTMSKLSKPTMIKTDVNGTVYLIENANNQWQYVLDKNGNKIKVSDDGIIGTKFKLETPDSYSGMIFKFYNKVGELDPATDEDPQNSNHPSYSEKEIGLINREMEFGTVGNHEVYGQITFSDSDYNSELSNIETYSINTLNKPEIVWASDLVNDTEIRLSSEISTTKTDSRMYESLITWNPVNTVNVSGNVADFYYIDVIGDASNVGNVFTIVDSDKTKRIGVWIPDPDPVLNMNKNLISQLPTVTTDYTIRIRAASFNSWYIGGSEPATAQYKIIKLNKPTSLIFDNTTLTLSWTGVTDANIYYIKDNGKLIATTKDTSYTFENLAAELHKFTVSAAKITEE